MEAAKSTRNATESQNGYPEFAISGFDHLNEVRGAIASPNVTSKALVFVYLVCNIHSYLLRLKKIAARIIKPKRAKGTQRLESSIIAMIIFESRHYLKCRERTPVKPT